VSVTHPKGFKASGVAAGLKQQGLDVALVFNDGPDATVAGVFTANRVKAAPVVWSQQVVRGGVVRAVVLNSGGANACTGHQGFQDTHATAEHVASVLGGLGAGDVAVCSTGLIGELLPMDKLLPGVTAAAKSLDKDGGLAAAEAIMTTDTRSKTAVAAGQGWSVGGMAKGAGMLAPGLATMLSVLTTDAVADSAALDEALRAACRVTFDRVDSDGCMSTNDTVLLLANGASGIAPSQEELTAAVTAACHAAVGAGGRRGPRPGAGRLHADRGRARPAAPAHPARVRAGARAPGTPAGPPTAPVPGAGVGDRAGVQRVGEHRGHRAVPRGQ
jgi:glutamate N-acetyltransferase/amino-acid N-acetyltransferase